MASDQVETVRAFYAALNEGLSSGDFRVGLEPYMDPEFEYHPPPGVPEPGPFHGIDEFERFLRFFSEPFDEVRLEIDDLSSEDDRVLLRQRTHVRGGASGMDVADRSQVVATVRDGRVLRVVEDYEASEARRRAGLTSRESR
jgi:ketosteroid isomerase-like protein